VAVRWTGSLTWRHASVGLGKGARPAHGQYWIGRSQIAALEPNLQDLPERAVWTPTDGGVDPVRTTEALVHAARTLGARVVLGSGVASLKAVRGRVEGVVCSAGFYPASTVVLAAGTGVRALCEPLGVAPTVGRLVATELVSGEPAAELRRCRPQRFST
jgi:glycine/D-amino acid oxidase-like deaminating enzyme